MQPIKLLCPLIFYAGIQLGAISFSRGFSLTQGTNPRLLVSCQSTLLVPSECLVAKNPPANLRHAKDVGSETKILLHVEWKSMVYSIIPVAYL